MQHVAGLTVLYLIVSVSFDIFACDLWRFPSSPLVGSDAIMTRAALPPLICALALVRPWVPCGASQPSSPVFYRTEDSDDWVRHTIHLQRKYARVLLVDGSDHAPKHVRVAILRLNARQREDGAPVRNYGVQAGFKTLHHAADAPPG